jgi:hypothetical protein
MGNIVRITSFILIICSLVPPAQAQILIYHPTNEVMEDLRRNYFDDLLMLALEKTRPDYGEYELQPSPKMEWRRLLVLMKQNQYPNMVFVESYRDGFGDAINASYINYPLDKGLLSYRICFVNAAVKEKVAQAQSLDELRQFTIAQGTGWPDVAVLRSNGFTVLEFETYPSLFKMVIGGRADLYCRGLNELKNEYETYKELGQLEYDESFVLQYPLPWFFYISNSNRVLHQRISQGLAVAERDGSLKKLWLEHFKSSIEFAKLKQRKLYRLENHNAMHVDGDYQHYWVDPFTLE